MERSHHQTLMRIGVSAYKGIVLAALIGLAAYFLASYTVAALGSILLALLLGMLVGNLTTLSPSYNTGIAFTSSKLLELSILFLAFSINYKHIVALGASSFAIIAVLVLLLLLITYFLSIKVKCPTSSAWLTGFGTSICGSSAIAALAPSVTNNKDDVAISMAVVNLLGSIGMIVLPIVFRNGEWSTAQMGLLIGGGLHAVGNVAGAGYAISNEVGEAAITIKLARVALLSPALIFFNYLVNRNNVGNWKEHFHLPWYLWGFIAITIFISLVELPVSFLETMDVVGKIILTIAMAAIGLKVSFRQLFKSGRMGVGFGIIIFIIFLLLLTVGMWLLEA